MHIECLARQGLRQKGPGVVEVGEILVRGCSNPLYLHARQFHPLATGIRQ
jgi:hypothetical protein